MAALLRQGTAARRLGGSMVQRAEAAVAEGRRRLGPRLMHTDELSKDELARQIQQKKEELYDATVKAQQSFWTRSWGNRALARHLAGEVKPRPADYEWHWLRFSQKANGLLRAASLVALAGVITSASEFITEFKVAWGMEKKEGGA